MKCVICEEELKFGRCTSKYCDVDISSHYEVKAHGFLWMRMKRPNALSAEGWGNWDALAKKTHPIRFYLSETVRPFFSRIRYRTFTNPYDWFRYRTFNRYHHVSTGLDPGWRDVDAQMLSTNFTMLVDFIEIEKASCMLWTEGEKNTRRWWQKGPFDNWRDANLGVKHLLWEMKLSRTEEYGLKEGDSDYGEPTRQAMSAKEQYELYVWWKEYRPLREDPMDASGLGAWYDEHRAEGDGIIAMMNANREARKGNEELHKTMMDLHTKIEEDHDTEDLNMLIRLMTIRQSLWS